MHTRPTASLKEKKENLTKFIDQNGTEFISIVENGARITKKTVHLIPSDEIIEQFDHVKQLMNEFGKKNIEAIRTLNTLKIETNNYLFTHQEDPIAKKITDDQLKDEIEQYNKQIDELRSKNSAREKALLSIKDYASQLEQIVLPEILEVPAIDATENPHTQAAHIEVVALVNDIKQIKKDRDNWLTSYQEEENSYDEQSKNIKEKIEKKIEFLQDKKAPLDQRKSLLLLKFEKTGSFIDLNFNAQPPNEQQNQEEIKQKLIKAFQPAIDAFPKKGRENFSTEIKNKINNSLLSELSDQPDFFKNYQKLATILTHCVAHQVHLEDQPHYKGQSHLAEIAINNDDITLIQKDKLAQKIYFNKKIIDAILSQNAPEQTLKDIQSITAESDRLTQLTSHRGLFSQGLACFGIWKTKSEHLLNTIENILNASSSSQDAPKTQQSKTK